MTSVHDAVRASELGVDAIGLVFASESPRCVAVERAIEICRALPPFVSRVGLFMNQPASRIEEVLARVPLDWLQFHGSEAAAFCAGFGRPWIRAIAMGGAKWADELAQFSTADALLVDSHAPGGQGGSGQTFDWSCLPEMQRPWILAGGLNPDNVAEACRRLVPSAVDVSSGVESRPGVKDDKLMKMFIEAVRNG